MGYNIQMFTINNKEIDFKCTKKGETYFIQVAYTISNEKTYKSEIAPFNILDNQHQKILITNDNYDYSTSTIRHIKLKDFLLLESL